MLMSPRPLANRRLTGDDDENSLSSSAAPVPGTAARLGMPLNIRNDGDVVVLSNFARLMNDPRYVDAGRDVRDLLDQGRRHFILDLGGVRETGSSFLGVLMTLTRQIRQHRGEAVLACLSRETAEL